MKTNEKKYQIECLTLNSRKMKTRNIFRVVASIAIAMVVSVWANAQVENSDYVDGSAAIDSVTVGTTMGYYEEPDATYHPDYNAGGGWAVNTDFTWTWLVPAGLGSQSSASNNYVEIDWTVAGYDTLKVFETSPAAYGGCDGDTSIIRVRVMEQPAVDITYVGTTDNCGDLTGQDVTIRLRGTPPFHLVWTYEEVNFDADSLESTIAGPTSTTTVSPLIINSLSLTDLGGNVWEYTLDGSKDFTVQNSLRTKYEYTVTSVTGKISRKSDYLDVPTPNPLDADWSDFDYYANIVDLDALNGVQGYIEIIVNPAPDTGPIYHIPNDWAE